VALPAVTILAAGLLASCQLPGAQRRVCVDPRQNVIDQRECQRAGGIGRYYYYHGSSFSSGSHASGGSFTSHSGSGSGSHSTSAGHVGRGGFGGHSSGG